AQPHPPRRGPARTRSALCAGLLQGHAPHRLDTASRLAGGPGEHGGLVPKKRGLVASHQGGRVPRLLPADLRPAQGSEGGACVRRRFVVGVGVVLFAFSSSVAVWGQTLPPTGAAEELPRTLQTPAERTEDLLLRNPPPALAGPVD